MGWAMSLELGESWSPRRGVTQQACAYGGPHHCPEKRLSPSSLLLVSSTWYLQPLAGIFHQPNIQVVRSQKAGNTQSRGEEGEG